MTRRKFLKKITGTALVAVSGLGWPARLTAGWLAKKTLPRKFVHAVQCKIYPGRLKTLVDICKPGKWSG